MWKNTKEVQFAFNPPENFLWREEDLKISKADYLKCQQRSKKIERFQYLRTYPTPTAHKCPRRLVFGTKAATKNIPISGVVHVGILYVETLSYISNCPGELDMFTRLDELEVRIRGISLYRFGT